LPFCRNIPVRSRKVHAADQQAACELMMLGRYIRRLCFEDCGDVQG
jgi:hypothetical protein